MEVSDDFVPYSGPMDGISGQISHGEVLTFLQTHEINSKHINAIKKMTNFTDEEISGWLNISVKTFRHYRKPETEFKDNIKEHVLTLLFLFKHGGEVFGSNGRFDEWLSTPNFFFDMKKPASFLNTITGIMFVDDRLTGMEFGDNV